MRRKMENTMSTNANIQVLTFSAQGLVPMEENEIVHSPESALAKVSNRFPNNQFVQIDKEEFNQIDDQYVGQKGISFLAYDGESGEYLGSKKPPSNIEICALKKRKRVLLVKFNAIVPSTGQITNVIYFKAVQAH
jgi:hypothetical protein